MRQKLHIVLIIFCLGIFIIPKQIFFAQTNNTEQCCKTSSKKNDCCDHNKKQESKKGCNESSCSACHSCNSCVILAITKTEKSSLFTTSHIKTANFAYVSPSISYYLKEIWQPPKLG